MRRIAAWASLCCVVALGKTKDTIWPPADKNLGSALGDVEVVLADVLLHTGREQFTERLSLGS